MRQRSEHTSDHRVVDDRGGIVRVDWPELAERRRQGSVVLYGLTAADRHDDDVTPDLTEIADLALELTGVDGAQVNLLDGSEQITLADTQGLAAPVIDRSVSLCSTVLARYGDDALVVLPDTRAEPALAGNPLVHDTDRPMCFYAGVPLVGSEGMALGMLCVWSSEPRDLSDVERRLLRQLGRAAVQVLDARRRRRSRHGAHRVPDAG